MKGFVSQYSLKNDQYPKTMQDMTDALSKHAFDDEYYERQKKKAEKSKKEKEHNKNNNNNDNDSDDEEIEASFAQAVKNKKYACYKCGKSDHSFSKCPLTIPKKEWWVNLQTDHADWLYTTESRMPSSACVINLLHSKILYF